MNNRLRSLSVLCLASFCALTFSCAKAHSQTGQKNTASSTASTTASSAPDSKVSAQNDEDLKIQKELLRVSQTYDKMSPRFKGDISKDSLLKKEFIDQLNALLKEDDKPLFKDLNSKASLSQKELSLLFLIDKKHYVDKDYEPKGLIPVKQCADYNVSRNDLSLRPEAFNALSELSKAALSDGIKLMVSSTYRSYSYQDRLFNRYVAQDGVELAERYSARAGTSQHQLGCAVDFGSITDDWGDTKMGKWVYQNAANYGWSLSFPREYEDVTGYMWECWHFRYIGKAACLVQKKWFKNIQQYMLEFINEY